MTIHKRETFKEIRQREGYFIKSELTKFQKEKVEAGQVKIVVGIWGPRTKYYFFKK